MSLCNVFAVYHLRQRIQGKKNRMKNLTYGDTFPTERTSPNISIFSDGLFHQCQ